MTSISTNSPLSSYLANAVKTSASSATANASSDKSATPSSDPLAQLRSYAQQLVGYSQGGLLRAYQAQHSGTSQSTSSLSGLLNQSGNTSTSPLTLPDVDDLSRDDAAKLMQQIDKLLANDQVASLKVTGFKGDQQTDSLSTYRTWLQDKGGISVHV